METTAEWDFDIGFEVERVTDVPLLIGKLEDAVRPSVVKSSLILFTELHLPVRFPFSSLKVLESHQPSRE